MFEKIRRPLQPQVVIRLWVCWLLGAPPPEPPPATPKPPWTDILRGVPKSAGPWGQGVCNLARFPLGNRPPKSTIRDITDFYFGSQALKIYILHNGNHDFRDLTFPRLGRPGDQMLKPCRPQRGGGCGRGTIFHGSPQIAAEFDQRIV